MSRKPTTRIDEFLVSAGHADSLIAARALIMAGEVIVDDQRVDKVGVQVSPASQVRLKSQRFVSRGGDKLFHLIQDAKLEDWIKDKIVMDVGSSTGGFTDCCLSLGARKVFAVDVGFNQLAWKLRQDDRVTVMEETDIRSIDASNFPAIDLIVADLSFISIRSILSSLRRLCTTDKTKFVVLIKPQFEVPKEQLPKGGVVASDEVRTAIKDEIVDIMAHEGFLTLGTKDSQIHGRRGNREIFVYGNFQIKQG